MSPFLVCTKKHATPPGGLQVPPRDPLATHRGISTTRCIFIHLETRKRSDCGQISIGGRVDSPYHPPRHEPGWEKTLWSGLEGVGLILLIGLVLHGINALHGDH